MPKKNPNRKTITTTLDKDLYLKAQIIALKKKVNANDILEEGLTVIVEKYKDYLE